MDHIVELAVMVYLHSGENGWEIDLLSTDDAALDTSNGKGPHTEACECDDEAGCARALAAASEIPVPNAKDLLVLLADELGYQLVPISD